VAVRGNLRLDHLERLEVLEPAEASIPLVFGVVSRWMT
jgi:hypothetical protein